MGWVLVHVQDDAVTVVVTRNSVCVYILYIYIYANIYAGMAMHAI